MRHEKQFIKSEYITRLASSPFIVVVDYKSLTVHQFTELRKRLRGSGSELHVVKNSIFRISAQESGVGNLGADLTGQVAVVTGNSDISAAAKTLKSFQAEFEKPKLKFGFLGSQRLEAKDLLVLADLPSLEVLRGKILGLLQAPAAQVVRIIATPAGQLARVIKAHADKG